MDYGHTSSDIDTNGFKAETLDAQKKNTPIERDLKDLGSRIVNTSEALPDNLKPTSKSGEIPLSMPPGYSLATPEAADVDSVKSMKEPISNITINPDLLREDNKKRISKETIKAVDSAVLNFENGKIDPAELTNQKQVAVNAYLKNSFGRELGK